MSLSEIVFVSNKKVSCDGSKIIEGNNQLIIAGHPKIYLDMGTKDNITCPYCGRHFTDKKLGRTTNIPGSSNIYKSDNKAQIND